MLAAQRRWLDARAIRSQEVALHFDRSLEVNARLQGVDVDQLRGVSSHGLAFEAVERQPIAVALRAGSLHEPLPRGVDFPLECVVGVETQISDRRRNASLTRRVRDERA